MPAATLARSVLLEARRGGLPWLAAGAVAIGLAAAAFLSQVALTETAALQLAVLAGVLRACAVFLVAAQVTAGTLREIQDKGLELMLSLPLSRTTHYLGRLAGFVGCGTALAVIFSAALLPWAPPLQVALWGISLAIEAALIAAAALFFAMTLPTVVAAIAATAGLYLLARAMPAIQALAGAPLAADTLPGWLARGTVDTIAFVLPRVDAATRTEWLVYDAPPLGEYSAALAALALYIVLLTAAGLFDFHRRNA
jgi:ABC-type transport system involved in multi-copper enzyme maturation permease subunit